MAPDSVVWVDPRQLEKYLEHDGTINDEEFGYDGAYLDALAEAGIELSSLSPIVLSVDAETQRASVSDGNHRLILALEHARAGHNVLVPCRVSAEPSLHPGFEYDGALGWPERPPMRRSIRRKSPPLSTEAVREAERQAAEAPPPTARQLRSADRVRRGLTP